MTDFPSLVVVGIEADGSVFPRAQTELNSADVIMGWARHLDQLDLNTSGKRREIQSLDSCVPTLEEYEGADRVVLLSTGDPLFYGIGRYLREHVPLDKLTFIPARSSVQLAFSSLKEEYNDALTHSLHGRDLDTLRTPLTRRPDKLALFTEPEGNTPRRIFRFLESIKCDYYDFYLCETLTVADEPVRVREKSDFPSQIDPLNLVVLIRSTKSEEEHGRPGIDSEWFRTEDDSMVSRSEVRMLNLSWLRITGSETVWEIGAGTGSISIESARLNPDARYHAIEKNPSRYRTLEENIHDLETFNVVPRREEAPFDFDNLPSPDRVVLGGSGGQIKNILQSLDPRLNSGVIVVANFITLGNFHLARSFFTERSYDVSLKQVTVHEERQFGPGYTRWDEGPCFYMIRAIKE